MPTVPPVGALLVRNSNDSELVEHVTAQVDLLENINSISFMFQK